MAAPKQLDGKKAKTLRDYQWVRFTPFVVLHVLGAIGLWQGVSTEVWIVCAVLYVTRIFGMSAGYHRYFAHRSFKTSRVAQFLLAILAQTTFQRGVLWWAYVHRHHHRTSDDPRDMHSMKQYGFWHSHVMWVYDHNGDTDYSKIRDFGRFPELVWLNKYWHLPPLILAAIVTSVWGWSGLTIGFALSTVGVLHATFCINSLAHLLGTRRFETNDESRNSWFLNILTLGEGWHNNHHRYQSRAKTSVVWWEIDAIYMGLKFLSFFGIVWDLKTGD